MQMYPYISLSRTVVLDSYYVMLTFGIIAGILVSLLALHKIIGWWKALVMVGIMVWGALFGAHLAHCLFHWNVYRTEPLRVLAIWRDGHSFLGAPAFCALLLLVVSKAVPGIPFFATADGFALGTPLGLFLARIGCYLRGCCWGIPIPEGHIFYGTSYKLLNFRLVALHPVQLYSAAADLFIFFCLLLIRERGHIHGFLTATFLFMYAVARFILEFFRGDTYRIPGLWNLSACQFLSLFLLFVSVCFFYGLSPKDTPAINHQ
jgi:phosphatidylglycerol:prolipoprotein diacylglycerol transferase